MGLVFPAFSASFNCAKAAAPIEHLICDFPKLDALDTEMGALYRFMREVYTDANARAALKKEQIAWLNARYGTCGIPKSGVISQYDQFQKAYCLEQLLYLRIEQLRIELGPGGRVFDREFRHAN